MREIVHIFVDTPNVFPNTEGQILPFSHVKWGKLYEIIRRGHNAEFNLFVKGVRYNEAVTDKKLGVIPKASRVYSPRKGKDIDVMMIATLFDSVTTTLLSAPKDVTVRVAIVSGDTDFLYILDALRNFAERIGREVVIEIYSWRARAPAWHEESRLLALLQDGFNYLDTWRDDIISHNNEPQLPRVVNA